MILLSELHIAGEPNPENPKRGYPIAKVGEYKGL
jgi:hypothetical protein